MKRLLLILSLTLGLANPVFALEAGERHADPYKVMTKGQVIAGYFSCLHEDYHMILPLQAKHFVMLLLTVFVDK